MEMSEQLNEISKHIHQMSSKIDALTTTVSQIDMSITGDNNRGVIGMKQHINQINSTIKHHTDQDESKFDQIFDSEKDINTQIAQMKSWIAGASVACITVTPVIVWLINKIAS